jgi:hypothetical protein
MAPEGMVSTSITFASTMHWALGFGTGASVGGLLFNKVRPARRRRQPRCAAPPPTHCCRCCCCCCFQRLPRPLTARGGQVGGAQMFRIGAGFAALNLLTAVAGGVVFGQQWDGRKKAVANAE